PSDFNCAASAGGTFGFSKVWRMRAAASRTWPRSPCLVDRIRARDGRWAWIAVRVPSRLPPREVTRTETSRGGGWGPGESKPGGWIVDGKVVVGSVPRRPGKKVLRRSSKEVRRRSRSSRFHTWTLRADRAGL